MVEVLSGARVLASEGTAMSVLTVGHARSVTLTPTPSVDAVLDAPQPSAKKPSPMAPIGRSTRSRHRCGGMATPRNVEPRPDVATTVTWDAPGALVEPAVSRTMASPSCLPRVFADVAIRVTALPVTYPARPRMPVPLICTVHVTDQVPPELSIHFSRPPPDAARSSAA